ncbi:hypothetical protein Q9L58_010835, partial [Maublancomyces gigas]
MYDFKVDAHTRLLIAQALLDNETISIITLHSGSQLRVICHFGHVALELITREKDLFGDVFDQVEEVLHGEEAMQECVIQTRVGTKEEVAAAKQRLRAAEGIPQVAELIPIAGHVIVIEDDPVVRMLLEETLAEIGLTSASFDNAASALTHLTNINGECALII